MTEKLKIVKVLSYTQNGVRIVGTDKIILTSDIKEGYSLSYDTLFDLQEEKILNPMNIEDYKVATRNGITISTLLHNGLGEVMFGVYSISPKNTDKPDFKAIIDEFAKAKFKVSEEGLIHNYKAWCADMKSGYRDEENGVFIFTPCGCNPLDFSVEYLIDDCDYQTTYTC